MAADSLFIINAPISTLSFFFFFQIITYINHASSKTQSFSFYFSATWAAIPVISTKPYILP